jgi:nitrile hydratase accessory protein
MALKATNDLTSSPLDAVDPVFKEPWEARAFVLACALQEQGLFSRAEWADQLGQTIRGAQAAGDQDLGDTYYQHWLSCLEALALAKGLATQEDLNAGKQSAHDAHQRMHAELGHFHSHSDEK